MREPEAPIPAGAVARVASRVARVASQVARAAGRVARAASRAAWAAIPVARRTPLVAGWAGVEVGEPRPWGRMPADCSRWPPGWRGDPDQ
ncbi:MAG: hypothetical protein ABSC16_03625 [Candidatus Dormibacteria bacterium]